jgi:nucleotide-binding universal stress UspA family protein
MSDAQSPARPLRILVCFDYTDAGGYAFEQAAWLARRLATSEIHLVYVTSGETSEARVRQESGQLRAYADAKAASLGGMDGQSVGVHVRHGEPVREIAQLAADIDIDVVVLGSPKHTSLRSWLHGTTEENLLEHSPCPVVVAGPKPTVPKVHQPAIEPPCPDCLAARAASHGAQWWCARHGTAGLHGASGHRYSYQRELPFASHDSSVIPTGIDL